mgnify:CR=1 FL=1
MSNIFKKELKNKFLNYFQIGEYSKALEYYNKYYSKEAQKIENYDKYLKISKNLYNNLETITEKELVEKVNIAATKIQKFLVENLCLLTLIKNPKNYGIFYIWAKYSLNSEEYWDAKVVLEKCFNLDASEISGEYKRLYAKILLKLYNNEDKNPQYKKLILEILEREIELEPNNIENYILLTRYYTIDYPNVDNNLLLNTWDKIIELEPDNAWFYSTRASIKSQINDSLGAIQDYNTAIKLGEIDYTTFEELASCYIQNNQVEKAIELYKNAIEQYKDNPTQQKEMYIGLASVYEKISEFKNAEEIYTQLLEQQFPDDIRIHSLRMAIREKLKQYELAIEDADFVLNQNDSEYFFHTIFEKGLCLIALNKYKEAIPCLEKIMDVAPFYVCFNTALCLLNLKKYKQALKYIKKAIKEEPEYSDNWVITGTIKVEFKHFDEALKDFNKALNINPKNFCAYRGIAFTYYRLGEFNKALQNINKAIEYTERKDYLAEEYYMRYKIYQKLEQEDKAQSDYNKTFELNPDINTTEFDSEFDNQNG